MDIGGKAYYLIYNQKSDEWQPEYYIDFCNTISPISFNQHPFLKFNHLDIGQLEVATKKLPISP